MTGFGRGQARAASGTITVELRSVNHRFLEVVAHVPPALQLHEDRVRDLLRGALRRGRVTCAVTVRPGNTHAAHVHLDTTLAVQYHRQLTRLARQLRLPTPVTLEQLLTLPRVLTVEAPDASAQLWWPLLERALQQALQRFRRMRMREGHATATALLQHLKRLERELDGIAARAPHIVTEHRKRLERRLRELASEVSVDPQRLAAEVALFAASADVAEEIARLRSHLAQCRRAVQATGEQGRALDFLVQEMGREANTIGSKANDYTVTAHVLAMKSALEKIREQVQNVE